MTWKDKLMNTPKKEDMIKELNERVPSIGMRAIKLFAPWVELFTEVSRITYLDQEIQKLNTVKKEQPNVEMVKEETIK